MTVEKTLRRYKISKSLEIFRLGGGGGVAEDDTRIGGFEKGNFDLLSKVKFFFLLIAANHILSYSYLTKDIF